MKCERCAFWDDCRGSGKEIEACQDIMEDCYDPSDEAVREDSESYEIDKADAKRKGEW